MAKIKAYWNLQLNCTCQKCNNYVNLLDDVDFWENNESLVICENDTPRTRDMEFICPECKHEFFADLVL